jgi:hypothetical protein
MKPWKAIAAICFALLVSSIMGASLAGADHPSPESTTPAGSAPESAAHETAPESKAALGSPCFANVVCAMTTEYDSYIFAPSCSESGAKSVFGVTEHAATNRCGNKSSWLRVNGNVVACMNPGGDRPHVNGGNGYNEVWLPVNYGAFC